ncbi:MAG: sigma-70 family RNA polymerase sigma factor [Thermoanaerobaculia bacterium]
MGTDRGTSHELTELLHAWSHGDKGAADILFPLVYDELRQLARRQLGGRRGQTLDTTGVVHEAYLKLVDPSRISIRDRGHFFCLAARAMRQILIDHARRRLAAKRGGGAFHGDLDGGRVGLVERAEELLALDEALEHLARFDPESARTVELRFFAGLSVDEAAEALSVSARTVKRNWARARAFLHRELVAQP